MKNKKANNSTTPDGFNPLRTDRPKSFNSEKVFTETVTPITDGQKLSAEQMRINLIRKTYDENLS